MKQYSALIGPRNQDYYLGYFRRADDRGYAPLAWHWAAFFLGPIWLLWRRQYVWAAGSFMLSSVFTIVAGQAQQSYGDRVALNLSMTLTLGWGIYLGLYGNAIYYKWAKRLIAAVETTYPENAQSQNHVLTQAGGVNRHLPLILTVVFILFITLASVQQPPAN